MNHVALLRGINVGGKNVIRMADLRECLDGMGLANVRTYIQSGNVLFSASESTEALEKKIETALSREFDYDSRVVVLPRHEFSCIVEDAPNGFGKEPEKFRYDVVFVKSPLTPAKAMQAVETRDGVDKAYRGRRAVYFRRLVARAAQSGLSKIASKPEYQHMTIRNWNTTSKLLSLLDEAN